MLIFGFIGVVLCLASVILLGNDISTFINNGHFKFTQILDIMHNSVPDYWIRVVNYINDGPLSLQKTITEFCVALPASVMGLILGFCFVLLGFRVRRYRQG
jgi:hypothetical protein